MRILRKQILQSTMETLILFQEDSLANHSLMPGNEKEQVMTAICGRKCLEQFGRFSRVTSWQKTLAGLLIGMGEWYSIRCKLIWKLKASRCCRFYFQLVPSTHSIGEIESGLLHTPRAAHAFMKIKMKDKLHKRYRKNDLMEIPDLNPQYLEELMGFPIGWTELKA